MSALNSNNLSKFKGLAYFRDYGSTGAWTRLASVRGLVANLDTTKKKVEVKADDTGSILTGFTPDTAIEFELLENADRDIIAKLFGGTLVDTAGTPVTVTAESYGTGWTQGRPFRLNSKNGANTVVSSIVVKAGASTLVLNTDYRVFVGDGTNGDFGYTYITPITTQSTAITVDYSYTPNATESTVITHDFKEAVRLEMKIEAQDPTNPAKYRTIIAKPVTFDGSFGLQFINAVTAGDLKGSQCVFRVAEGGTIEYANQML